jgi:hypothetical protein
MIVRITLWFLPWLLIGRLWGQVEVSVVMLQEQYLPGEAITLKVRVLNHSGQTLVLGEDNRWLRLGVQEGDASIVRRLAEVPVTGRFVLAPSQIATKELNIEPFFAFSGPGRYSVRASLWIQDWDQTMTSEPEPFNIVNGTKLWEQSVGLRNTQTPGAPPEVRKYLLQQANYLKSQIRLYARVTDVHEERTFGVVPIGPMVSFSRPRAMVDRDSNLHVLYQSGPRVSTYCKISPDAEVLAYEKREYSGPKPRLSADEDGTVSVRGGVPILPPPSDAKPSPEQTGTDDGGN